MIRIPLPGLKNPIGLGTAVAKVLEKAKVKPTRGCGCGRRKDKLNKHVELGPRRKV